MENYLQWQQDCKKTQLSILTDFGCEFNCSFCITNSQKTKKSINLNIDYSIIKEYILKNNVKRLSISGGGEPLFIHNYEIIEFYSNIIKLAKELNLELSVHSNYMSPDSVCMNLELFHKIAVSVNAKNFKKKYKNWNKIKTQKRFIHVSDCTDYSVIEEMISNLPENCQFTVKPQDQITADFSKIRELVNSNKNCLFLEKGDYNKYFVLTENKIYDVFKEIKFK